MQIQREIDAAREYLARQSRSRHPDGDFDKKKRFYPSDRERQDCCSRIRRPSAAWPFSLMVHCRTLPHVARLYGVSEAGVRRALRALEKHRDVLPRLIDVIAAVERLDPALELTHARLDRMAEKIRQEVRDEAA
jgi:hypothetical protein